MKIKELLLDFTITFLVVFIVAVVVTFLFNFFIHNLNEPDLPTSIRMAFVLGILFPWLHYMNRKRKVK